MTTAGASAALSGEPRCSICAGNSRSKGSKRSTPAPCNLVFFIVMFPLLGISGFNRQSSIRGSLFPQACLFQNLLGASRIENTAGAETGQIHAGLLRRAPPFLDPIDHLAREGERDHAVAAHGGKFQHTPVSQAIRPSHKSQGVFDTVPVQTNSPAALPGAVCKSTDIDRYPQVRSSQLLDEFLYCQLVIEYGGHGGRVGDLLDDLFEIRSVVAKPVGKGIQFL